MAAPKNPAGAKSDKLWRDAIMRAVRRISLDSEGKPTQKLEMMADRIVEEAMDGNIAAAKEVGDRLDGRAVQQIEVGKPGDFDDKSDDELIRGIADATAKAGIRLPRRARTVPPPDETSVH